MLDCETEVVFSYTSSALERQLLSEGQWQTTSAAKARALSLGRANGNWTPDSVVGTSACRKKTKSNNSEKEKN